ncbi:type II toxin-antitoxin system RatA family toxin [Mesorhizobium sp. RP14(2022)]|uniref:Type II toxin-antitoxin system RatA family toxin n=1 Tax=Mesorhizobium liriopis TaxID=2953882 RepID=A0ABT1C6W9_9HYPH|nr:type II toxin-antitoxin system RatA family toxin [Mesorhizobium liriopis]MCO6050583.1 type II toxin-antitoxin system RatA family toxin [Mesorhizobium liriopis]
MPQFQTERHVRYTPDQMFALVADIERYPEFLPLCEGLAIRSRRERDGQAVLAAEMTVGYMAIRESFTTQVHLKPAEHTIDAKYLDGPFRYLNSQWRFEPAPNGGCTIHFSIDYEFRSRMLGALMGAMFDRAFRKFAEAFEKRADTIYGATASASV